MAPGLSASSSTPHSRKNEANDGRDRVPVRIYDLKDPRVADIRSAITDVSGTARTYLLTVKP